MNGTFFSLTFFDIVTDTEMILSIYNSDDIESLQLRPGPKGTVKLEDIIKAFVFNLRPKTNEKTPRGKFWLMNRYS
jgi:hypothetical protein